MMSERVGVKYLLGLSASLITGVLLTHPVFAQFTPIFENVTLSPGTQTGETVIRGISGGDVPARVLSDRVETPTGPCVGFVDEKPDHILTLTSYFNFLNIQVKSSADTTLLIKGPGGSWCNDDAIDDNPGIAGEWLEGSYEIWVGSYEQNDFSPYVIRITETP